MSGVQLTLGGFGNILQNELTPDLLHLLKGHIFQKGLSVAKGCSFPESLTFQKASALA
jgi:hypothetical protein